MNLRILRVAIFVVAGAVMAVSIVACADDIPDVETVCADGCDNAIGCGEFDSDEQQACEAECHDEVNTLTADVDGECEDAILLNVECFANLSCDVLGDPEAEEEACADEIEYTESTCGGTSEQIEQSEQANADDHQ